MNSSKPDTPNRNNQFWRDCFRTALHARLLVSSPPRMADGTPYEAAVTEAVAIADLVFGALFVTPKPAIPVKDRPVPRRASINEIGNVSTHNK